MGYSRFDRPISQTQRFFNTGGVPVTMTIIAINIVLFLVCDFKPAVAALFICALGHGIVALPWTLITYPLLTAPFFSLIFGCLWLFSIGGFLERSWGRGRYILFFLVITLTTSLGLLAGSLICRTSTELVGLWVPLAAFTVAWAAIDPYQETLFYFVIKVQARWVAWLSVGLVYFGLFYTQPLLGLFSLFGCVVAFYWVRGRVPYSIRGAFDGFGSRRQPRGPDLKFYDVDKGKRGGNDLRGESKRGLLGRYQEYKERKKLEKLFRDSGFSDDDDRPATRR